MVNDVDTLDALEDQLKVSLELLENEARKEDGVIVQLVKVKRKVKESNIKDEILKAKLVKSNLTGRVGVKAKRNWWKEINWRKWNVDWRVNKFSYKLDSGTIISHIGGLTDSSIGKCQQFDIVPRENGYIQILHADSMHCICVANMTSGKSSNQVHYVFDSLFSRKVQQDVIHQIAAYSFCLENELIIHVMPVHQQKNGVDCALFSIAFPTSLAFGEDPSNSTYDSVALRPHLIKCLTSGRIALFPKIEGKQIVRWKPSTHTVEIFCSCRTPRTAQRNSSYAACAQNGTINDVKKYYWLFFVKTRKRGFAVDVKTEMLRKEYDYID